MQLPMRRPLQQGIIPLPPSLPLSLKERGRAEPPAPILGDSSARIYIKLITPLCPPSLHCSPSSLVFSSHFYSHSTVIASLPAVLSPSLHPYHYSAQWRRGGTGERLLLTREQQQSIYLQRERERERASAEKQKSPSLLPSFNIILIIYDSSPRKKAVRPSDVRPSVRLTCCRSPTPPAAAASYISHYLSLRVRVPPTVTSESRMRGCGTHMQLRRGPPWGECLYGAVSRAPWDGPWDGPFTLG